MGNHSGSGNSNKRELAIQGLRYAITCSITLGVKVLCASLLSLWLMPVLAYLIVHLIIFFVSYAIHSRFTFSVPWTQKGLTKYFKAVFIFKAIDLAGFCFLSASCGLSTPLGIVIASVLAFVLRFMLIRNALFGFSADQKESPSTGWRLGSWPASQGKCN